MRDLEFHIKKEYSSFHLDVRLTSDAKRIGILGASGSGKSMTLKALAGIVTPDTGRIVYRGTVLFDRNQRISLPTRTRKVGYLFQNYALFPNMSVRQNIEAGYRGAAQDKHKTVEQMMERFRLTALAAQLPHQLSGGQQQRTALARILINRPEMILLDEPFSALDGYLKDHMKQELAEQLADYDGTVIMVTHDRDDVFRFSEELLVIDGGSSIIHGKTRDIFSDPRTRETAKLTGCKNFSRAERLDDHTFRALDWGVTLHTKYRLPQSFGNVGYRAHEFEPIWGARRENCIRFVLNGSARLQFERNFYLKPEKEPFNREDLITWYAQRTRWEELDLRGLPDFLQFREEHFLFLT